MGTDCRLLAKLKDGTYRHRALDRLYVFNQMWERPDGEYHYDIYSSGGLVEERGVMVTNRKFSLEFLTEWCYTRRKLIVEATPEHREQEGIRDDADYSYYIFHINRALDFVVGLLDIRDQIEWLGLWNDMDDLYFDLKNEGATIIDI